MKNTRNSADTEIIEVNCPQCGKAVLWVEEETFRPFCSKRCQMIDFGDWANERNTIPVKEPRDDWEDFED